jgi:non-specific serine/threonine protein kinase
LHFRFLCEEVQRIHIHRQSRSLQHATREAAACSLVGRVHWGNGRFLQISWDRRAPPHPTIFSKLAGHIVATSRAAFDILSIMSITLFITPHGRLQVEPDAECLPAVPESTAEQLGEGFTRSNAEGLLLLASQEQHLPSVLAFWRGVTGLYFQAVCQLGEGNLAQWTAVPAPGDEQLVQLAAAAPPMRGLEFLNVYLLRSLWAELAKAAAGHAEAFPGGPAAFLRTVNPLWHLLGRVTFHLAENKRNPDKPFAFLATYTHRLSGRSRLQHLPLAEALKTYAGAKERQKLESLLEPVQRAAGISELVSEMLANKTLFAPQAWSIKEAYRFLKESVRIEGAGVVVRVPDWWSMRKPPRPQVQVRLGSKAARAGGIGSLLDFDVGVALDGEPLSEAECRQLLAGTEGLTLLRGKWVEVDQAQLQQALAHWKKLEREHENGIEFIEGMRLLAGAQLDTSDAADERVASWSRVTAGDWLRQTLERLRRPETIEGLVPGRDLQAVLRPYQVEGVRWLSFMTELGLGACLADDMGLGKTIQVIDLLLQRKRQAEAQPYGPSLLIVPATLIGNWRQELARFAPTLRVFIAHRSECVAERLERVANDPSGILAGFDLVITTFGLARRHEWLERMNWSLAILDEAQAIKNASAAQSRSVKKLQAAGRIVLTGTPVENHLGDLWSLFDFCCPGLLGTANQFKQFVKRLNQRQDAQAFGALRRLVRPYILRRLKTDPHIVPDLPEKIEMRAECGLSKKQAALYAQAVANLEEKLEHAEGIARRGLVLSTLMQLKQICNHPAQYLSRASFPPEESGKFQRLRLLCEPIAERQEQALIFTQFQSLTHPLASFLAEVFGREGLVLHGGTPVSKRGELVRRFQDEQGPPFFVVSLKAGGSGLNLTAASHVVHFDRWWNPAVENQATDRAFRIGQKRNVLVHKFLCRGTVEERIDEMISSKQGLADELLNKDGEARLTELSDEELLRFVALDIGRATADE